MTHCPKSFIWEKEILQEPACDRIQGCSPSQVHDWKHMTSVQSKALKYRNVWLTWIPVSGEENMKSHNGVKKPLTESQALIH